MLEELHNKQQREGLTETELGTLMRSIQEYERQMMVHAQAVSLLKERGHDISELISTS